MNPEEKIPRASQDQYVARQAVFDRQHRVVGYELLFRSGPENFFSHPDGDGASRQVIESSLNTFGLGRLSEGSRTFINVTPGMILQGCPTLLPPKRTALELVGSGTQDESLISALQRLATEGCWIVLDDFTLARAREPAAGIADVLKVDFSSVGAAERAAIVKARPNPRTQLLAKKVESRDQLLEALEQGYSLFQGFFFCKPEMIAHRELPTFKANYLRLMGEVNREGVDYGELDKIIKADLALSLKILRYVNSALFSLTRKVDSIRQAISMVGTDQIRKWATLLAVSAMAEDRPPELVITSLVRGCFCEGIVKSPVSQGQGVDLFLVGLLSLLDVILGIPMDEALAPLPISEPVKGALLRRSGEAGRILQLVIAYERAEWDQIPLCADRLPLDITTLPYHYRRAIAWTDEVYRADSGTAKRPR
ncbi:MAG TPA: HDOD domain-containing protein [Planctomycetota bacterium]|nr:HDOD domain-containing protein [Planctomycetota bacterium]